MEHFREALELNYQVEKSTCTLHCTHPFAVPVRLSTDPWKRETITWFNWEGKGATQFARSTVMQTFLTTIKKKQTNKQTNKNYSDNQQSEHHVRFCVLPTVNYCCKWLPLPVQTEPGYFLLSFPWKPTGK